MAKARKSPPSEVSSARAQGSPILARREVEPIQAGHESKNAGALAGMASNEEDPTAEDASVIPSLIWRDRRHARLVEPAARVLETVSEHSDPTDEDPGNLVIEGDNCQALVSLRYQYGGQVDVVCIDPPFNTGKGDFRYSDKRFWDPDADVRNGSFVSSEEAGRHAKWLNEMWPTLRLLRQLMRASGVIFVHINDIELPRLLLMMEDLFGERNRLGTIVWKGATDNNPTRIAVEHEYIAAWAKDIDAVPAMWKSLTGMTKEDMVSAYKEIAAEHPSLPSRSKAWRVFLKTHSDEIGELGHYKLVDEEGPYTGMRALHNPGREGYRYDVIHPNGKPVTEPMRGYRYPEHRMKELLEAGRILFGPHEKQLIQLKVYLSEAQESLRGIIDLDSRLAANTLAQLFPNDPDVFRNPKPVELEQQLLSFTADREALVLDCFAGSGTTAHAVMRLNGLDGGRRRWIMIERGEPDDPYATTLTAERIRRARTKEGLPGGFTFKRVGDKVDEDLLRLQKRDQVAEAVLMGDASGRGGGIREVPDKAFVIGVNRRGEAICLSQGLADEKPVTRDELRAMLTEVRLLGFKTPMRVYGTACEVYEDERFSFFQLPDEVLRNLRLGSTPR